MSDAAERLTDTVLRRGSGPSADKELDDRYPNMRPRDAATLILIDRSGRVPKVLLGRRHQRHKFMPGKFVFPGGRVEPVDRRMPVGTPLHPRVEARLMQQVQRPSPAKARGYALAAIRETSEETGLLLGKKLGQKPARGPAAPGLWADYAAAGLHPDLASVHFIARAITPPRRIRRYDSRFFAADAETIGHRLEGVIGPEAELVELVWVPLAEAKELDMPVITEIVLEELDSRIAAGFGPDLPVPFFFARHGRFHRELL
jgi:8-oxo-dGTP pyrophosphatase MutT (NUDIX family)